MIDSDREALIDKFESGGKPARFGGPFLILGLVLAAWVAGRAALWENPFPVDADLASDLYSLAEIDETADRLASHQGGAFAGQAAEAFASDAYTTGGVFEASFSVLEPPQDRLATGSSVHDDGYIAAGHSFLWHQAVQSGGVEDRWRKRRARFGVANDRRQRQPVQPGSPPFFSRAGRQSAGSKPNRWTLDIWAFGREGATLSRGAPGPAPVYGASQIGANLQFRAAPASAHDPRAYLRASRALIDQPESDVALGVSARPLSRLPVRVAAEVRATDNAFGQDIRPATFAITQAPPISLPLRMSAEVYAAAGYVGGDADTGFAEGQATLTRRVVSFDLRRDDDVRVNMGAGAWGGAQRGVSRIDVGPTLRMDLSLGAVPARVSIDYRERVGGDAAPGSGVAATLSTQF